MKKTIQHFISTFNSYCSTIQFTYGTENHNRLPILDLTVVIRNQNGSVNFDIYKKTSQNDRCNI